MTMVHSTRDLRILADSYLQVQKTRIAIGNRLDAAMREVDEAGVMEDKWRAWFKTFLALEKELDEEMRTIMESHPAWGYLQRVKGVGLTLGAQLVSRIEDAERDRGIGDFATVSKLWRFCVGAPINGKVERPEKGKKLHYSARLKTILWKIGGSFLRCNSPYRRIYDEAKEYYQANRDWTKLHIHNAALRKMEKIFLAHLWDQWRKALGLPTNPPYILDGRGHSVEYKVDDFLEPIGE